MPSTTTFVLVHGAWHGAWCWDRVTPLLEAAGAAAVTPTLRGVGERADGTEPIPGLEDHVADVVSAVDGLPDDSFIVLVGHSYAGMVITPAADRLGGRVDGLVYLDAAVPSDGDDFASHIPGLADADAERRRTAFRAMAGGGDWLPPPPLEMVGVVEPQDQAWLNGRLTAHPLRTWLEPAVLGRGGLDGLPRTYVLATAPLTSVMGYPLHGERAKSLPGWSYAEIATGHDMMVTDPRRVADILLAVGRHRT